MDDTFEQLEHYLEKEGFDIQMIGGRCPFQIEANHSSGISVYFRSRGEIASLEVYDCYLNGLDRLPDDDQLLWFGKLKSWQEYEAGWLTWNEGLYVFYMLWQGAKEFLA